MENHRTDMAAQPWRVSRRAFLGAAGVAAAALGGAGLVNATPAAGAELQELAVGASYTVTAGMPDPVDQQGEDSSYPDSGHFLTDGKLAGTEYTDSGWRGYLRQASRTVVIDLGAVGTIHELSVDFLFYPSAAVFLPKDVQFALSLDGTTWHVAGTLPGDNVGIVNGHRVVTLSLPATYARYVQVTFDVNGWCFVDEISARGTRGIETGATPPQGPIEEPVTEDPGEFLKQGTGRVGGVENMFLAYTYDTQSSVGEIGRWSAESLQPVITRVDESGASTDWMWDTVLFVAGGSELDGYPDQRSWDDLLDRLFEPDNDVAALDQAAATAKQSLNDQRHIVRVVLPIPNPVTTTAGPWGSIDGDVLDLNPTRVGEKTSADNRLRVVRWFVDEALRRYNAENNRHIELAGFYWMRESIAPNSSDSVLVQRVSQLLRAVPEHLSFYWIPYYQAAGYQHWQSYGFEASMMQPNYFFDSSLSPTDTYRLERTATMARWSGQGVELEIDDAALTDAGARQKWLNYLAVDQQTGADRAIKGYYWGSRATFAAMVGSTDPDVRHMYDAAYEFIRRSR